MEARKNTDDRSQSSDDTLSHDLPTEAALASATTHPDFLRQYEHDMFYLSEPIQYLFDLVMNAREPVIQSTQEAKEFTQCLFVIDSFNIAKFNLASYFKLLANQIALTAESLDDAINLLYKFNELDQLYTISTSDRSMDEHCEAIANIKNLQDLRECIYNLDIAMIAHHKGIDHRISADISTTLLPNPTSGTTLLLGTDTDMFIEVLPSGEIPSREPEKQKNFTYWLYPILTGAVIGAVCAAIVIVSVVTAGGAPLGLGLSALIGIAVAMSVGSITLGGIIGGAARKLQSIFQGRDAAKHEDAAPTVSHASSQTPILRRLLSGSPKQQPYQPDSLAYKRLMQADLATDEEKSVSPHASADEASLPKEKEEVNTTSPRSMH